MHKCMEHMILMPLMLHPPELMLLFIKNQQFVEYGKFEVLMVDTWVKLCITVTVLKSLSATLHTVEL